MVRTAEALAEENALKAILEITAAYEELMLAHKKEVYCTVITAQVRCSSGWPLCCCHSRHAVCVAAWACGNGCMVPYCPHFLLDRRACAWMNWLTRGVYRVVP